MPALLHTTLYAFCLGVSCIHLVFAAWSAADSRQKWDHLTRPGEKYSSLLLEHEGESLRSLAALGVALPQARHH